MAKGAGRVGLEDDLLRWGVGVPATPQGELVRGGAGGLDRDRQRVASYKLDTAGPNRELEGGGAVKGRVGGQEPFGRAQKGRRGDQEERENGREGQGGEAGGPAGSAKVLDLIERYLIEVRGELLNSLVDEWGRGVASFAFGQLEKVDEPVGHLRMVPADLAGHLFVGRARQQAEQLAEGAGQDGGPNAEGNGGDGGGKGHAGSCAEPQPGFEEDGQEPDSGNGSHGHGAPECQVRPRHATGRLTQACAEAIDETSRLLTHGPWRWQVGEETTARMLRTNGELGWTAVEDYQSGSWGVSQGTHVLERLV